MKKHILYFIVILFTFLSPAYAAEKEHNFLVISDIHLQMNKTHPMEISPSALSKDNDLDQATFEKLITELDNKIKSGTIKQPKFIMILGDIVGHQRETTATAQETESYIFQYIKNTFPNTPIFYTFGNNDSLMKNYGPFYDTYTNNPIKSPYEVAKFESGWDTGFLSSGKMCDQINDETIVFPCLISANNALGYYSAYLDNKLRMISMNSVMFSPKRNNVTEQDAEYQLDWLENQLKTAEQNQERVLLAMHISPGKGVFSNDPSWVVEDQDAFLKMIKIYKHIIIGLLASHSHTEEIKIIKNEEQILAGVYFAPGLSTSHGNEPAVKTFFLNNENEKWELSNYETFHYSQIENGITLSKLYDYQYYYCNENETNLLLCLNNVTPEKMKLYFTAGNPNLPGFMNFPENIILSLSSAPSAL